MRDGCRVRHRSSSCQVKLKMGSVQQLCSSVHPRNDDQIWTLLGCFDVQSGSMQHRCKLLLTLPCCCALSHAANTLQHLGILASSGSTLCFCSLFDPNSCSEYAYANTGFDFCSGMHSLLSWTCQHITATFHKSACP